MLTGNKTRKMLQALRVGTPTADLVDTEIGVRAVGQPDGSRSAGHLFHDHHMLEVAQAEAPKLLLGGDAMKPQRTHLGP